MIDKLRVVLLGYIVRCPLGGMAWHHLQYAMGLERLGHEVYFVEDSDDYASCYDPSTNTTGTDPSYGIAFATDAFGRVGLADRWCYYDAHRSTWHGPLGDRIVELAIEADLLINLGGVNPMRGWTSQIPVRVFIDQEPALTQVRHLNNEKAMELARGHNRFLSFGENIGGATATVPDDGFPWKPTRQPIVLDAWPVTPGRPAATFTTVMQWDSHPPRVYDGRSYGMKSDSFMPFVDLPQRVGPILKLAVGSDSAPRRMLESKGWILEDPLGPTRDPWTYQDYIRNSRAEFSVAKHGYVITDGGWFSERSAAYLASGRPVLTQETGWSKWMPAGEGALTFSDLDEAVQGVESINGRYNSHCRSARELAAEYFDARRVLSELIDTAMAGRHAAHA